MKLYFYGKTKEEAQQKCKDFYKKAEKNDENIYFRVTSICVVDFNDPNPVVEDFKYRVFCEYKDLK